MITPPTAPLDYLTPISHLLPRNRTFPEDRRYLDRSAGQAGGGSVMNYGDTVVPPAVKKYYPASLGSLDCVYEVA